MSWEKLWTRDNWTSNVVQALVWYHEAQAPLGKAIGEVALVLAYERFLNFFYEPTLQILMNMTR